MSGYTLAIDTSGAVSVSLARGDSLAELKVLSTRLDARARHHDEVLLALIDEVLAEAGASRAEIKRVIAGRGPGPFTGLRVGLVTARSIATVLGAELWGLCSLDALAVQALSNFPQLADAKTVETIAVALDARRKEVYYALYRNLKGQAVRVTKPRVGSSLQAAEDIAGADLVLGSGALLYEQELKPTPEVQLNSQPLAYVDAGYLIQAAFEAKARTASHLTGIDAGGHELDDLNSTEPIYLRDPDAAKPSVRKSALGLEPRAIK